jgi:hypothetical protein
MNNVVSSTLASLSIPVMDPQGLISNQPFPESSGLSVVLILPPHLVMIIIFYSLPYITLPQQLIFFLNVESSSQ